MSQKCLAVEIKEMKVVKGVSNLVTHIYVKGVDYIQDNW